MDPPSPSRHLTRLSRSSRCRTLSSTTPKTAASSLFQLPGTNRSSTPTSHRLPRLQHPQPLYIAHPNLPSIRRRLSLRHTASKRLSPPMHLSRHPGTAAVPTFLSSLHSSVLNPTGLLPIRFHFFFNSLLAWHHEIYDTIIDFYCYDFRTRHIKMGLSAAFFVLLVRRTSGVERILHIFFYLLIEGRREEREIHPKVFVGLFV